jgi:hypothetical protein
MLRCCVWKASMCASNCAGWRTCEVMIFSCSCYYVQACIPWHRMSMCQHGCWCAWLCN